jgi:hypothetical protein
MKPADQIDDDAHQKNHANHFSPYYEPCKVETVGAEQKKQDKREDQ